MTWLRTKGLIARCARMHQEMKHIDTTLEGINRDVLYQSYTIANTQYKRMKTHKFWQDVLMRAYLGNRITVDQLNDLMQFNSDRAVLKLQRHTRYAGQRAA